MNIMKKINLMPVILLSLGILASSCVNKSGTPAEKEGAWEGCVVGMFTSVDSAQFPDGGEPAIEYFEKTINHQIGSVAWFPTWDDDFPTQACMDVHNQGAIPHLTWELFWPSKNPSNTHGTDSLGFAGFNDVLSGKYDAYIDKFAQDAKNYKHKVLMRFLHEFNGNWYVWSGNKNGAANGGPEKVIAVWKYVVDRFNTVGATNVKWLWVPHGPSIDLKTEAWNQVSNYWPGDDYVDWIGLDGYNFYPIDPWGGTRPLRDFDNCFRALYDSCAILGDQPMMIAEFGTGEFQSGDFNKAAWISDAFTKIKTDYPRIKIFTWFNINKEHDWRVNSSPESHEAFKKAMADPYYIGSPNQ